MTWILLSLLAGTIGLAGYWYRKSVRLLKILDSAPDFLGLYDANGEPLWVNSSVKTVLGFEPGEPIGSLESSVHPEDLPLLPPPPLTSRAVNVFRSRRKDGAYVWLESYATPILLEGQTYAFHSSRDITARKATEDLYKYLLSNLPDTSVFLFDKDFRHLVAEGDLVSKSVSPTLPSRRRPLREVLSVDIAQVVTPYYVRALAGETSQLIETFGGRVYECCYFPIQEKELGFAVFRDVTEKRSRLKELEDRTADLERSNRDLEQFAHVASHELKGPLRRVSSFVDLLTEEISQPSRYHEYLSHITEGVASMDLVVESLLHYSRVDSNPLKFSSVNVSEIVEAALRVVLARGGKEPAIRIDPLPEIVGDLVLLQKLFENLIGNAIKFNTTATRPLVEVLVCRELLDWRFSVRDNGPGIEYEQRGKVFSMFSRLRPDVDGTGIGLALCKKIVEIHRGRIWFESDGRTGTTFHFTLPA